MVAIQMQLRSLTQIMLTACHAHLEAHVLVHRHPPRRRLVLLVIGVTHKTSRLQLWANFPALLATKTLEQWARLELAETLHALSVMPVISVKVPISPRLNV